MVESEPDVGVEQVIEPRKRSIWIWAAVTILKICFTVYDAVTFVPIKLFANPSQTLAKSRRVKAMPTVKGDPGSPWRNISVIDRPLTKPEVFPGCDTLGKTWDECVRRFGKQDCFGTREVISVHKELQPDGRYFEKLELGQYHWKTYNQVAEDVAAVAKGLIEIGQQENETVVICSETCAEWMTTALACFKCNFPVTTVYSTLGEEAMLTAINESRAITIFVSDANLPQLAKDVEKLQFIKTIIYYSSRDPKNLRTTAPQDLLDAGMRTYSYEAVFHMGQKSGLQLRNMASPDDLAIIMYTSGTTGRPKGVLMTHKNILCGIAGHTDVMHYQSNDIGVGYLPLAHIYEICIELNLFIKGCKFGYSSPQTLLDNSTKLAKGQTSDVRLLKPTLLTMVPTVMNRVYKEVTAEISRQSPLNQEIFKACYEWKRSRWLSGYPRCLLYRLLFKKFQALLGGRVREICVGSAPLNVKTEEFIRTCFNCRVAQGYGLTETTGGGALTHFDDRSSGSVGPPETTIEVLLRKWSEGGYSPYNEKPQGEILIAGECITRGYFNNPEKTKEDYLNIDGKKWFATGDIGEFREDGSLLIIDRKKDLIKLAHGEYISLGQIEAVLLTNPLVDNVCMYAGFQKSYAVALVVPNLNNLKEFAKMIGIQEDDDEKLCANKTVVEEMLSELQLFCKGKLLRVQIPQRIHLCPKPWQPASGLVTEALKLKRKAIEAAFKNEISEMYEDDRA